MTLYFILSEDLFSLLNDWSTKLRNRTLFKFSSSNIESIEVIKEDKIVKIFTNTEDSWEIYESNDTEINVINADHDKFSHFLGIKFSIN